jgi:hypothetical protein
MEDTKAIQELLSCPELSAVQSEVAHKVGLPILNSPPGLHDVLRYQRVFHFLRLTCEDARKSLVQHREPLIRFAVAIKQASNRYDDDGEFAPGEEPGHDERSRTIGVRGLADGFGIDDLCFFLTVRWDDNKRALDFLKFRRIPHARNFYRNLKEYYRDAHTA